MRESGFEMEFYILLHEYQPFHCVLQFGNVRCEVISENSWQIYDSTPFCLANTKVLDLGKYCEFDRKLIGFVSFIHSSTIWTNISETMKIKLWLELQKDYWNTKRNKCVFTFFLEGVGDIMVSNVSLDPIPLLRCGWRNRSCAKH